jgi:RNA polymerase sigma-70 factor (ECF subfamily)
VLLMPEPREQVRFLVRAAQKGQRPAFESLYRAFAGMVHGVLLAHVRYPDVEDLMQDVFLRAMEQLDRLREPEAFGGWLCAIARRAAFDYHRGSRPVDELPAEISGGDRPDGAAFEVLDQIRDLPESYRETLMMRLVEGMTGPEIAARTGLTPDSVRVNLCRGMKLLRERLEGMQ